MTQPTDSPLPLPCLPHKWVDDVRVFENTHALTFIQTRRSEMWYAIKVLLGWTALDAAIGIPMFAVYHIAINEYIVLFLVLLQLAVLLYVFKEATQHQRLRVDRHCQTATWQSRVFGIVHARKTWDLSMHPYVVQPVVCHWNNQLLPCSRRVAKVAWTLTVLHLLFSITISITNGLQLTAWPAPLTWMLAIPMLFISLLAQQPPSKTHEMIMHSLAILPLGRMSTHAAAANEPFAKEMLGEPIWVCMTPDQAAEQLHRIQNFL